MVKKVFTLEEIRKEIDPKKHAFFFDPESGYAAIWLVYDEQDFLLEDAHFHRVFKIRPSGRFDELDWTAIQEEIAEYLKDKISIKAWLKDVIMTKPPEEVIDILERIRAKAKVKERPQHCFEISLTGKRGRPMRVSLR